MTIHEADRRLPTPEELEALMQAARRDRSQAVLAFLSRAWRRRDASNEVPAEAQPAR